MTLRALTPGWARAPLWPCTLAQAHALPPSTSRFPPHSRAALLQSTHPRPPSHARRPVTPASGFIAIIDQLDAHALLALHQHGARGAIITQPRPPDRHTLVIAAALGLPLATLTPGTSRGFPPPSAPLFVLDTQSAAPLAQPTCDALSNPTLASGRWRRALPLNMAHTGPAERTWLELIHGQPEELWLAREALRGGVARGVGLLRLEYLFYADPGMDTLDLSDALDLTLQMTDDAPVALRLTDWSPDKPPSADTPLQQWRGLPGLAGIHDTTALTGQLEAIQRVAVNHPARDIWCVAPRAEDAAHVAALRRRLPKRIHLAAMIESQPGLDALKHLGEHCQGFWVGLGDLGQALGLTPPLTQSGTTQRHDALIDALNRVEDAADGRTMMVCGWI